MAYSASSSFRLMDLPYEVFVHILVQMVPGDLWTLSRCSMWLHDLLWSRQRSLNIWQQSRKNTGFYYWNEWKVIPPPPPSIAEPLWAAVTTGNECMNCPASCEPGRNVGYMMVLCSHCQAMELLPRFVITGCLRDVNKRISRRIFTLCYLKHHHNGYHLPQDATVDAELLEGRSDVCYSLDEVNTVAQQHPNIDQIADSTYEELLDLARSRRAQLFKSQYEVLWWHELQYCLRNLQRQQQIKEREKSVIELTAMILAKFDTDPKMDADFVKAVKIRFETYKIVLPDSHHLNAALQNPTVPNINALYGDFVNSISFLQPQVAQYQRQFGLWEAFEGVRNVLEPFFNQMQYEQPQPATWPAIGTLITYPPCQALLQQVTTDKTAIFNIPHHAKAAILKCVKSFLPHKTQISEWSKCKQCGMDMLSIVDLVKHPCMNYWSKDPQEWLIPYKQPMDVNSAQHYGIHFDYSLVAESEDQELLRELTSLFQRSVDNFPSTHADARDKKFECVACLELDPRDQLHNDIDYRTLLNTYFFHVQLDYIMVHWMSNKQSTGFNNSLHPFLLQRHLIWRIVPAEKLSEEEMICIQQLAEPEGYHG